MAENAPVQTLRFSDASAPKILDHSPTLGGRSQFETIGKAI